jgi:amidase
VKSIRLRDSFASMSVVLMTKLLHVTASRLLLALGGIVCSSGCVPLPGRPPGVSRDRIFITYWPLPASSRQVKVAIKDNIDLKGTVTTAGSENFARNNPPADHDAACLANMRRRNVHIVGKTNLSEFAVAPSGINDYFGTPGNPLSSNWRRFIPGGSSCGSACAVATGKADIAIGTDTAGSIRVPAACCGVVGLKTTLGRIPLKGVHPIEPLHMDTVGPLARNVAGVAQGMDLLEEGFAARYASAVAACPPARSIKIGRLVLRGTDPKIDQAVDDALERAGFDVIILEDDLRAKWEQAHKDGTVVAAAGAWLSDKQFSASLGVTARTRSIIIVGGVAWSTQYQAALARRAGWQRTLQEVFKRVDFIALPTLQKAPPLMPFDLRTEFWRAPAAVVRLRDLRAANLALHPVRTLSAIPATSLRLLGIDLFEAEMLNLQNTAAVNFAGNPALALPVRLPRGRVPVTSVQLIGPMRSEAKLLAAARFLENGY